MPATERLILGTIPIGTESKTINQGVPRAKLFFDIRTDATLDSELSVSFSANMAPDFNTFNGLLPPKYSGTILVGDLNKVIELAFNTPVNFITFTYSGTKKLYLAQFDWLVNNITRMDTRG